MILTHLFKNKSFSVKVHPEVECFFENLTFEESEGMLKLFRTIEKGDKHKDFSYVHTLRGYNIYQGYTKFSYVRGYFEDPKNFVVTFTARINKEGGKELSESDRKKVADAVTIMNKKENTRHIITTTKVSADKITRSPALHLAALTQFCRT